MKLTIGSSLDAALRQMINKQQSVIRDFGKALEASDLRQSFQCATHLRQVGISWNRTDHVGQLALGQVLSSFRGSWANLPPEFTSQYEDSFERFVQESYMLGIRMAHDLADDWEALLSGQYVKKLPARVDPYSLSIGRRRAATLLIFDGKMTAAKWDIIIDENLTTRQVYAQLFGKHHTMKGKKKRQYSQLITSTGEIRLITADGKIKFIGSFDYKTTDTAARQEMFRILKAAGIEVVP